MNDNKNTQSNIHIVSGSSIEIFRDRNHTKYSAIKASPYLRAEWKTDRVMLNVLLALTPAIIGSLFFFGISVIPYYVISIAACFAGEILCFIIKREKILLDFSSVVTGTLLAMSIPSSAPLWVPALGGGIGIIIGKQLFGGIGCNFLNPALFGRAFLRLVFPVIMTMSVVPNPPFDIPVQVDSVSSATPLAIIKDTGALENAYLWDSFIGMIPGKIGETSAVLLLIGAAYLIYKKIIKVRIPLSMIGAIALMAVVFGGPDGLFSADIYIVLGHILGGATLLAAFFMATDYSSSPTTTIGEIIFGAGCGIVAMIFRLWSSMPEGITFAIVIMNVTVPFIDYFIRPRVLGERVSTGNN